MRKFVGFAHDLRKRFAVFGVRARFSQRDFGAGSHHGDRRAQFVRGIRGELRDLAESRIQAREHGVDSFRKTRQFVARGRNSKPIRQILRADRSRRLRHLIDGPQRAPAHPISTQRGDREEKRRRGEQKNAATIERALKIAGRDGHRDVVVRTCVFDVLPQNQE